MTIRNVLRSGVPVLVLGLIVASPAVGVTKPLRWTPSQARAALMSQAEDFYVQDLGGNSSLSRDLSSVRCRGTGKAVQHRFVSFLCSATVQLGAADPLLIARVSAKTRRAGGLCWAVLPKPIPSGCLAAGKRGMGSPDQAFRAMAGVVGTANLNFRCWPNGAGFFSCSWTDAMGVHRGTVVFAPQPVVKVLS